MEGPAITAVQVDVVGSFPGLQIDLAPRTCPRLPIPARLHMHYVMREHVGCLHSRLECYAWVFLSGL